MAGKTTDTRLKVLDYIVTYLEGNRSAPTRAEIAEHLGLKVRSSVQYHVDRLVEDGYLERSTYRHRMVKPTEKGSNAIRRLRELDGIPG